MNVRLTMVLCLTSMLMTSQLQAQEDPKPAAIAEAKPAAAKSITVAILDFDAADPTVPDLGKQIAETLNAVLTGEPGFTLVDRAHMTQVLHEQELNLSGLVNSEQAAQIGKLVGAKILVTGKVFPLGQQMFMTAKLIGTETSLVEAAMIKDKRGADLGEMVVKLSDKVGERLRTAGPKLIAGNDADTDPLPALKAKLANRKKPVLAVIIPEDHVAERRQARLDPAVETEIKLLLQDAGFTIQDVKENALADWARSYDPNKDEPWPRSLTDVQIVIAGEGFSEFLTRIGNLVSCAARAEINMIDRSNGKILLSQRVNTRAVDLAENIAGKKALEKAGRTLGIEVLRYFEKTLPEAAEKKE